MRQKLELRRYFKDYKDDGLSLEEDLKGRLEELELRRVKYKNQMRLLMEVCDEKIKKMENVQAENEQLKEDLARQSAELEEQKAMYGNLKDHHEPRLDDVVR